MNSVLKNLFGSRKEHIGLSSFKPEEDKKPEIKKESNVKPDKTSLTGLLKRTN